MLLLLLLAVRVKALRCCALHSRSVHFQVGSGNYILP
ncbi:hypothetical protein [Pseudomonas phage vB_Pa-PAC2]|nr:hypothetical protein ETTORE_0323 [Pseudomonas phage Ettore]